MPEPPAKKKVKGGEEDAELKIKAFRVYGNMSNGSLDDVLVWNGQTKSGVKGRSSSTEPPKEGAGEKRLLSNQFFF